MTDTLSFDHLDGSLFGWQRANLDGAARLWHGNSSHTDPPGIRMADLAKTIPKEKSLL
jgi:hypothetical protein